MGGGTPPIPAVPPTPSIASAAMSMPKEKPKQGFQSTILTTPGYSPGDNNAGKKTLLGQ